MLKRTISESWSFFWPNIIRLGLIQVPLYLLMVVASLAILFGLFEGGMALEDIWLNNTNLIAVLFITLIVFTLSFWIYSSTIVYLHHTSFTGSPLGTTATWKMGLKKLIPIAWISLALSLVYLLIVALSAVLYYITPYLALFGVIITIFVSTRFFPAIYIKVIENEPSFHAIKISWHRTQGRFWSIFLGMAAIAIIMMLLDLPFTLLEKAPNYFNPDSNNTMTIVTISVFTNLIGILLSNLMYAYQYRIYIHTQPPVDVDDNEKAAEQEPLSQPENEKAI